MLEPQFRTTPSLKARDMHDQSMAFANKVLQFGENHKNLSEMRAVPFTQCVRSIVSICQFFAKKALHFAQCQDARQATAVNELRHLEVTIPLLEKSAPPRLDLNQDAITAGDPYFFADLGESFESETVVPQLALRKSAHHYLETLSQANRQQLISMPGLQTSLIKTMYEQVLDNCFSSIEDQTNAEEYERACHTAITNFSLSALSDLGLYAAQSQSTPPMVLNLLCYSSNMAIAKAALQNARLPLATMNAFSVSEYKDYRVCLLMNPNVPRRVVTQLLIDADEKVQAQAVAHIHAKSNGLAVPLTINPSQDVRAAAAANPNLDPALFEFFAEDISLEVVIALAGNPSLDRNTIERLMNHDNEDVVSKLAAHPMLTEQDRAVLLNKNSVSITKGLVQNPWLTKREFFELVNHTMPEVRALLASQVKCTALQLKVLATDPDSSVRLAVVQNPSAPITVLKARARDVDPRVRQAVMVHSNTPADLVLNTLSHDPHFKVREQALLNPQVAQLLIQELPTYGLKPRLKAYALNSASLSFCPAAVPYTIKIPAQGKARSEYALLNTLLAKKNSVYCRSNNETAPSAIDYFSDLRQELKCMGRAGFIAFSNNTCAFKIVDVSKTEQHNGIRSLSVTLQQNGVKSIQLVSEIKHKNRSNMVLASELFQAHQLIEHHRKVHPDNALPTLYAQYGMHSLMPQLLLMYSHLKHTLLDHLNAGMSPQDLRQEVRKAKSQLQLDLGITTHHVHTLVQALQLEFPAKPWMAAQMKSRSETQFDIHTLPVDVVRRIAQKADTASLKTLREIDSFRQTLSKPIDSGSNARISAEKAYIKSHVVQDNGQLTAMAKFVLASSPSTLESEFCALLDSRKQDYDFDLACAIAASEHTPSRILNELASSSSSMIRALVAKNKNTDTKTLIRLMDDQSDCVMYALASNLNLPSWCQARLAKSDNKVVCGNVFAVAPILVADIAKEIEATPDCLNDYHFLSIQGSLKNPHATTSFLDNAADVLGDQPLYLHLLVRHPNCGPTLLDQLSRSRHQSIVSAAARHSHINPERLTALASSGRLKVRASALSNKNTATEIVNKALVDPSHVLRAGAAQNPQISSEQLWLLRYDPSSKVRKQLASHAHASPQLLKILARDIDPKVRLAVAKNSQTDLKCVLNLLQQEHIKADVTVFQHPKLQAVLADLHIQY